MLLPLSPLLSRLQSLYPRSGICPGSEDFRRGVAKLILNSIAVKSVLQYYGIDKLSMVFSRTILPLQSVIVQKREIGVDISKQVEEALTPDLRKVCRALGLLGQKIKRIR